jgi:hypothetical protein
MPVIAIAAYTWNTMPYRRLSDERVASIFTLEN